jgi:hypothetical protein
MTYHDTPQAPLTAMKFTDTASSTGDIPRYSVRTVNSVGLESRPTSNR